MAAALPSTTTSACETTVKTMELRSACQKVGFSIALRKFSRPTKWKTRAPTVASLTL